MENEKIVVEELSHLLVIMNDNFSSLREGNNPNVFSTDPEEDALKIAQLMDALFTVLAMYKVPNAVA